MADGTIKIAIEIDGKQVEVASKSLDNLEASGHDAGKGVKQTEDGLKNVGNESNKASGNVKKFATSLGLVAIAAGAFKVLKSSLDAAISRFDTLNTFPKVLQELGVSAGGSERAMSNLSDGIDGLPTKLDEIASTAQRMYSSFDDMDLATDSAIALNNALLGSGSSADQAKRGTEQYLKALQTGKVDMMLWNTLSETMDVGLIKIAEGFGFAGRSAKNDLYAALQGGTITIDEFNAKLIEIGTGTGDMARLAKENSLGLATSIGNLGTAVSRNVANMIEKFDNLTKEVTGKTIAENIDGLKDGVNTAFNIIGRVIEGTTPIVLLFADGVKATIPVAQALTPAIIGLMTAYGAYVVITKASTAIKASNVILAAALTSQKALTIAKNVDTAATAKNTGAITLGNAVIGLLTGKMKLATARTMAQTAATTALAIAKKALQGPIGWVTLGIGALVTATIGIVKWFKRSTEEGKKLTTETDSLGEATDSLADSVNNSSEAYAQNQKDIKVSAEANRDLIRRIEELSEKENKSAEDKLLLNGYINRLNESVDGLNLSYNEEADALSESSEKLRDRIDLIEEETSFNDALSRQNEITEEMIEVELQREKTNELMAEANVLKEEGAIANSEYKKEMEKLEAQEESLIETEEKLKEENKALTEQIEAGAKAQAEATSESIESQIIDFENLEGAQKEAFDSMVTRYEELAVSATDAFDKIETESEHTMESMTETMLHNQEVVSQWAENQAKLMEWAGKNGYDNLIPYIENMGIDSAAELAVMAGASEDEMIKFADALETGAELGGEAFKTSLSGEFDEVIDQVVDFVDKTSTTMAQEISDADFEGIGGDVAEGFAVGMDKGTPEAEEASKDMAGAVISAAKDTLDTHSPSKVFEEIGGSAPDGMVLGINKGTKAVIQSMKKLAKSSIVQFSGIKSEFDSIGKDAMSGFRAGLNARSGAVLGVARSIANRVASTMRQALQTRSPSKVTEEIGADTGDGVSVGLLSRLRSVEKASKELAKAAVPNIRIGTPEMALGTSRMAYAGAASTQITNNNVTNTQVAGASSQNINVSAGDVYLDGYKVGEIVWRPVKDNIDREDATIKQFRG